MMNALAICLVLISIATAGVLSPSPQTSNPKVTAIDDDRHHRRGVILEEEGHRIIVVEYEKKQDTNNGDKETHPVQIEGKSEVEEKKPATSDAMDKVSEKGSEVLGKTNEKAKSSVLHPNIAPRELICDALGKCKHKVASAMGKAKSVVSEKTDQIEGGAKEAVGKAKDVFSEKTDQIKGGAKEAVGKAKDVVSEKTDQIEGGAKEAVGKAKDVVSEKTDQIEGRAREASEKLGEGKKMAGEAAGRVKNKTEKDLGDIFKRGGEVVRDAGSYLVSRVSVEPLMGVLQLLGLAVGYGSCVWITFVSSHVLARALPRQQYGVVQSKMYPAYFTAMAYGVGASLLAHLAREGKRGYLQGYNLLASLLMVLANLVFLEPKATKAMFEKMKLEKEEGRGGTEPAAGGILTGESPSPSAASRQRQEQEAAAAKVRAGKLGRRLRELNSYSSSLNILTLMCLTWHLVYLGQRLGMNC